MLERNEWWIILWGENPLILKRKVKRSSKDLRTVFTPICYDPSQSAFLWWDDYDRKSLSQFSPSGRKPLLQAQGFLPSQGLDLSWAGLRATPLHAPDLHTVQQTVSLKWREGGHKVPPLAEELLAFDGCWPKSQFSLTMWSPSGLPATVTAVPTPTSHRPTQTGLGAFKEREKERKEQEVRWARGCG